MDEYDLFSDRVKSLLERWDKMHKGAGKDKPAMCIKGFLAEVNDDFTKGFLEQAEAKEHS